MIQTLHSLFIAKQKKKKGETLLNVSSQKNQLEEAYTILCQQTARWGTALNWELKIWMILLHQEFHL